MQQQGSFCDFSGGDSWVILSPIEQSIKQKIEAVGTPLKDWDIQINYGIKTGFNDAFIITSEKRDEILSMCSTEDERKRTDALIRPILRGRDIKRYGYEWAGLYLIATFPARHYDIEKFPAVKQYLLSFAYDYLIENGNKWVAENHLAEYCKKKLAQTGQYVVINGKYITDDKGNKEKGRKKTSNKWFETQDSISYWEDFSKPKAMWKIIGCNINFSFDYDKFLCNNAVNIITGDESIILQFVGIMNSKLFDWYLKLTTEAEVQGGGIQLYVTTLEKTLVKLNFPQSLSDVVRKRVNSESKDYDVDLAVFEAYKLTDEERMFILTNKKVNRK